MVCILMLKYYCLFPIHVSRALSIHSLSLSFAFFVNTRCGWAQRARPWWFSTQKENAHSFFIIVRICFFFSFLFYGEQLSFEIMKPKCWGLLSLLYYIRSLMYTYTSRIYSGMVGRAGQSRTIIPYHHKKRNDI